MYKFLIVLFLPYSQFALANKKLNDFLFDSPDKGVKTEALVVAKNGKILIEKFIHGNPQTRHLLWSMSKSISSLIFGIVEDKGYLSRDDSIYKFYPKYIDSLGAAHSKKMKEIKLKDFLEMSSGLDWNEFYEEAPFSSDVVRMLYFETKKSTVNYVLKTKVKHRSGTRFLYSSGDTNVFMGAIQKVLPENLKQTYPWHFFFDPMEMNATFETDGSGVFLGSSYVYLTTGDLLKLGELILNKGMYKGKQIVPKDYIEYATGLNTPFKSHGRCLIDSYMTYGAQFWLNHLCPNGKRPFEGVPSSLVMLLGHGGQSVFIFPEQKIVAVRIAQDAKKALDRSKYAKLLLEAYAK